MNKLAAADLRNNFSDALNRAHFGKERVLITRNGKPLAALISAEDLELLQTLEDTIDLRDVRKARTESKIKGTLPLHEVKRQLGLK